MENQSEYILLNDFRDLEDINLPPIMPITSFEHSINNGDDNLSPLPKDDEICNLCIGDEFKVKQTNSPVIIKKDDISGKNTNQIQEEAKKTTELKKELYHTCCTCKKKMMMRNMFSLDYKNPGLMSKLICLTCALHIDESYFLHDWTSNIECDEYRHCPRCKKDKPSYKFKKYNKYCDYCLIKKKWLRLKSKLQNDEMYGAYEESGNSSSDEYENVSNRKVRCCSCNLLVNIDVAFLYFKVKDYFSNRYICLKCSLNVSNCHLLHDWEDYVDSEYGRMCNRCKRIKSLSRFKIGHLGCDYCSLKRRRLYLLTRK